jgi:AraC-like DNA-binding protein
MKRSKQKKGPPPANGLAGALTNYLVQQKPFLREELRITDVAEDLNVSLHDLSRVINQELGMTFFDLINHYRVEEAKKLLKISDPGRKILAIALEVGFGNKATFNRVFKRLAGCTPSEYKNR